MILQLVTPYTDPVTLSPQTFHPQNLEILLIYIISCLLGHMTTDHFDYVAKNMVEDCHRRDY